ARRRLLRRGRARGSQRQGHVAERAPPLRRHPPRPGQGQPSARAHRARRGPRRLPGRARRRRRDAGRLAGDLPHPAGGAGGHRPELTVAPRWLTRALAAIEPTDRRATLTALLIAIAAGSLWWLASPRFDVWPLAWIAPAPLVWLIDRAPTGK